MLRHAAAVASLIARTAAAADDNCTTTTTTAAAAAAAHPLPSPAAPVPPSEAADGIIDRGGSSDKGSSGRVVCASTNGGTEGSAERERGVRVCSGDATKVGAARSTASAGAGGDEAQQGQEEAPKAAMQKVSGDFPGSGDAADEGEIGGGGAGGGMAVPPKPAIVVRRAARPAGSSMAAVLGGKRAAGGAAGAAGRRAGVGVVTAGASVVAAAHSASSDAPAAAGTAAADGGAAASAGHDAGAHETSGDGDGLSALASRNPRAGAEEGRGGAPPAAAASHSSGGGKPSSLLSASPAELAARVRAAMGVQAPASKGGGRMGRAEGGGDGEEGHPAAAAVVSEGEGGASGRHREDGGSSLVAGSGEDACSRDTKRALVASDCAVREGMGKEMKGRAAAKSGDLPAPLSASFTAEEARRHRKRVRGQARGGVRVLAGQMKLVEEEGEEGEGGEDEIGWREGCDADVMLDPASDEEESEDEGAGEERDFIRLFGDDTDEHGREDNVEKRRKERRGEKQNGRVQGQADQPFDGLMQIDPQAAQRGLAYDAPKGGKRRQVFPVSGNRSSTFKN